MIEYFSKITFLIWKSTNEICHNIKLRHFTRSQLFMYRKVGKNFNTGPPKNRYSSQRQKNLSLVGLHELFIKFKLHGARNASTTIEGYRKNFKLFLQFNSQFKLKDLTEKTVIDFLEFLNTRERKVGKQNIVRVYKSSSIAVVRSRLNVFFRWLLERHYIESNPFEKIPYPDISYTDRRAFNAKEFETICYAVSVRIHWINLLVKKRNIAIIMFLAFTGVRKEELLGLLLSDIDLKQKIVSVRGEISKSKRTRIIPLNPELISYLLDYFNYRRKYSTEFLWVSGTVDRAFTIHGAKHLVKLLNNVTKINCHLHRFRHTFATNYYKQTHDLVGLHKLLGHSSLKMTLSYLRSLPDDDMIEQVQKMTIDEFI